MVVFDHLSLLPRRIGFLQFPLAAAGTATAAAMKVLIGIQAQVSCSYLYAGYTNRRRRQVKKKMLLIPKMLQVAQTRELEVRTTTTLRNHCE
jgi:hypothetical protein